MKTTHIFGIMLLFIALVLALVIVNFYHPVSAAKNFGVPSSSLQATPTPAIDDTTVIGSTDGIMLMGVIISAIIIVPLLFRMKKEKNKNSRA
ncbi:MAG: hypothetical protein HY863_11825 [Chloroflexi bacterium]|nr:hypothetical protein [Chloroflexota bacterium]